MGLPRVPAQGAEKCEHERDGHAADAGQGNGFNHATM
jgi:hypothetical protein